MVKKSVLVMSVLSLGLALGSGADAVKEKAETKEGPMDKFVTRTPISSAKKSSSSFPQDIGSTSSKRLKAKIKVSRNSTRNFTDEELYILGRMGVQDKLTPMQKGWLNK